MYALQVKVNGETRYVGQDGSAYTEVEDAMLFTSANIHDDGLGETLEGISYPGVVRSDSFITVDEEPKLIKVDPSKFEI